MCKNTRKQIKKITFYFKLKKEHRFTYLLQANNEKNKNEKLE